ncbi:hypothetical protein FRUB_01553 [Fimbriiglobus ruber]|uniref:Uncharacterized protein n=1 Tax=Fimbriiglobus ruber TaxID=1908690 RepID=A0A225DUZ3_9BACT|nr:hypothetical protein FRUB_01553 [Fimbriiglobus ruber]
MLLQIYRAGGPNDLNDWAQELIREHDGRPRDEMVVDRERIPRGVSTHLSENVRVQRGLSIELGGGFYHYGVIVYPRGKGPPPEWWQHVLGWPPEVCVYHEE